MLLHVVCGGCTSVADQCGRGSIVRDICIDCGVSTGAAHSAVRPYCPCAGVKTPCGLNKPLTIGKNLL